MIEIRMLGATDLRLDDSEVHSLPAAPKRFGLFVYLILARPYGFQRRDRVLSLFWPERGQKAARNALSNMIYHIRQALGEEVIVNRGAEEVGVRMDRLWTDVHVFEGALDRGEVGLALDLYRGDLLEGFHVPDAAPQFGQWLDRERERLRLRAAKGAWLLAKETERAGDWRAARAWAKKAAGFTPFSAEAQTRLITLLDRLGDRAGALRAYEAFAARLRQEWALEPSNELKTLVERVRARAHPAAASPGPLVKVERDLQKDPGEQPLNVEQRTVDLHVRGDGAPILRPADVAKRSIAVLPFETLGEPGSTAFSEGIHEGVLTRLSTIDGLWVISRTSVRRYKGTEKPVPEIARELDVVWVVEGGVQEVADQFQVNVRLIEAAEDRQAWAQDYLGELTAENVFEVQGKITKKIVKSLKARLTPEAQEQVEKRPTENLDAYRFYVQGRSHLDRRTEDEMRRALDYFERVIELDPDYALAWVGLADALGLLHSYGYEEADRMLPRAEDAIRHALALDPNSAEAHAALGRLYGQRNEALAADRELRRAVELKPSYAEAHNWQSVGNQVLGRRIAALESAKRAVELNPLSPEVVYNLAISYLINGEHEMALTEARRERELASSYGSGAFCEGLVLYEMGRFEDVLAVLQGLSVPWAGSGPQATLAQAHLAMGDRAEGRDLLARIEAAGDQFDAGLVHAALGETEEAFAAFQRVDLQSVEHRLSYWPTFAVRYLYRDVWDTLRDDPRYEELRREVDRSWGLSPNPGA